MSPITCFLGFDFDYLISDCGHFAPCYVVTWSRKEPSIVRTRPYTRFTHWLDALTTELRETRGELLKPGPLPDESHSSEAISGKTNTFLFLNA